MTTRWLRSLDRPDWPAIRVALEGTTCAWADLDGWQVGDPPELEPVGSTHLWAWATNRQVVVRLGGYRPIVVELTTDYIDGAIEVQTFESAGLAWTDDDKGVSIHHPTGRYQVISVLGPTPLTFVAA